MTDEKLYSSGDIQRMLGISSATLARAARLGKLPSIKLGPAYGFKLPDVEAWIAKVYRPEMAKRTPSKFKRGQG